MKTSINKIIDVISVDPCDQIQVIDNQTNILVDEELKEVSKQPIPSSFNQGKSWWWVGHYIHNLKER